MEIPPVVNSEGSQFRTVLGSHAFSAQESCSENGSPDHGGDDCPPGPQTHSLLVSDQDGTKLKKSFAFVSSNNVEFPEAVSSQEPQQVIPAGALLDPSPLASGQVHEAGTVFTSPSSNEDCCYDSPLPLPVTERQSDQAVPHQTGATCSILRPDSTAPLVVPAPVHDSGRRFLDLPRIVKHKLSSITFSDNACAAATENHAYANESSDDGASSPEEDEEDEEEDGHDDGDDDDDDDEDLFPELPQSRELHVGYRHRRGGKAKQKRRGAVSGRAEADHRSNGHEAEEETSSKEVKSPWSESMSQLMRKLDQLNLDIEEALSASSSPSNTPCTARKKQLSDVILESTELHTGGNGAAGTDSCCASEAVTGTMKLKQGSSHVRCRIKVHSPPNIEGPGSPKTRLRGMSEPSRIFCSSQRLSGNKSKEQEDGSDTLDEMKFQLSEQTPPVSSVEAITISGK
ncbi:unnamed protein product [Pleuronectes platessa]|uniref:Uncharacterized protein n=1 Tax=Pleuronectes platessa TaxID=8262 RepID=A0A9N7U1T4_PLEPL|nr:unnamed protein product [Pleuronectes platessa]